MNPLSTEKAVRERIIQLKDEVNHLIEMKERINQLVDKVVTDLKKRKEEELSACFDSSSPLLSMGHGILSKMLEFCDESTLLQVGMASRTLHHISLNYGHWEQLYHLHERKGMYKGIHRHDTYNIPKDCPELRFCYPAEKELLTKIHHETIMGLSELPHTTPPPPPRDVLVLGQVRYFGAFSGTAEVIENLSEKQYHHLQGYSKFRGLTIHQYLERLIMPTAGSINLDGKDRYFLRFSRWDYSRGSSSSSKRLRLMWQGFISCQPLCMDSYRFGEEFDLTDQIQSIDWPELKDFFNWMIALTAKQKKQARHKNERFRTLVENIRMTLICCDGERTLVTGGCRRVRGDDAFQYLNDVWYGDGPPSFGNNTKSKVCIKNQKLFLRIEKRNHD